MSELKEKIKEAVNKHLDMTPLIVPNLITAMVRPLHFLQNTMHFRKSDMAVVITFTVLSPYFPVLL